MATKNSEKQIAVYETKMTTALQAAEKCKIKKFEDVMEAADFLFEVKAVADKLEEEKTTVLKPFLEGAKLMRKIFKKPEETYEQAEKVVKDKILEWHAQEWGKGKHPDNTILGLNGKVTVVERIRVQVEDPNAIPREFCMPDPEKVMHALQAGITVPGASLVPSYSITAGKN